MRVVKYDPTGKYLTAWGSPGSGSGQFGSGLALALAVDEAGTVYVVDPGNSRIETFGSMGDLFVAVGWRLLSSPARHSLAPVRSAD